MHVSIMSQNLVPYNTPEGLELFVDETNGLAYASNKACERMFDGYASKGTIGNRLKSYAEAAQKSGVISAEIQTGGGIQAAQLYPAFAVFKLALEFHPELAEAMGAAGANVYMLGIAGYEVKSQAPSIDFSDPLATAQAYIEAETARRAAEKQLEAAKPKLALAEAIESAEDCVSVGVFAKITFDQHGMGRNKLFRKMRDLGILMKGNIPYQSYIDSGWFEVTEVQKNGRIFPIVLITGKGQVKVMKMLTTKNSSAISGEARV